MVFVNETLKVKDVLGKDEILHILTKIHVNPHLSGG